MYMYWYVQVVGHMNWNCLANLNFSVDIKMFLYFMLINLYSSNKWICIYIIFCHFIYYFSVLNKYNIFFSVHPSGHSWPLIGWTILYFTIIQNAITHFIYVIMLLLGDQKQAFNKWFLILIDKKNSFFFLQIQLLVILEI